MIPILSYEKACMYLCQMISKQRATSVGFDDLVDAFRFECRVQALNSCRKFQPSHPKDHKLSLFYSYPRDFPPCSSPFFFSTSWNQTFSLSNYFLPFSVLPSLPFTPKSLFLFLSWRLLCSPSLLRSILGVCVLKYLITLRYAQFHHFLTGFLTLKTTGEFQWKISAKQWRSLENLSQGLSHSNSFLWC